LHLTRLPALFGPDRVWDAIPERSVVKDAADEGMPLSALGARGKEMRDVYAAGAERLWKAIA
ncbi:hypothetical protein, partial [Streptomyces pratensis]|uniref:hypothetical protein n=1 Tax=Streptomyces pratensis TaxID=1169025 RepID=UPI0036375123